MMWKEEPVRSLKEDKRLDPLEFDDNCLYPLHTGAEGGLFSPFAAPADPLRASLI